MRIAKKVSGLHSTILGLHLNREKKVQKNAKKLLTSRWSVGTLYNRTRAQPEPRQTKNPRQ